MTCLDGGNLYLLAQSDTVVSYAFTDPVGGVMVRRLAMQFQIFAPEFYFDLVTGNKRH